jgi:hypothetical protein
VSRRIILGSLIVLGVAGVESCARDAGAGYTPAAVEAKASIPAPLSVLAEAADRDGVVVVQVLDARHATADTVRIRLAFISKATDPQQQVPLFAADTNPADFCLLTTDGTRRLFLLRDAQNQPVLDGNLHPLRPGERRVLDLMFPAPPSAQSTRVTLRLGKLTFRNLPISTQ